MSAGLGLSSTRNEAARSGALFAVVLVVLVVGFLEITFGLLAFASPRVARIFAPPTADHSVAPSVPDPRLGHRPSPAYPGHDRKGFRNPEMVTSAEIVALGDSQTYGTGVEPQDAWPRQLSRMTGESVYSMAYGGYGPPHSLVLWDEAVALTPRIVIEAFYTGNDLFDSFHLVYNQGEFPELRSADPHVQDRVRDAEQAEPIARRVTRMFRREATATPTSSLRGLIAQHSKIYGLARRALYEIRRLAARRGDTSQDRWEAAQAFARAHPAYCQVFSDGPFKTIFTSEYRLAALDLGDPRIAEGLRISLRAMQRLEELAAAGRIRLIVVLIPTKETVFRELWRDSTANYRTVTASEERVSKTVKDFLERHHIEYLDALPVLREQLAIGIQPYQVTHDGHPNEHGHKAIAKLVADHLKTTPTPRVSR
jgi:lysophospholipase L1-like esterase